MVMRPGMVRRRPLLRAAAIGGTYAAGRAAGRRAAQSSAGTAPEQEAASQQEAGGQQSDVMSQLNQLTAMHDSGALSDEEFTAAKAKVLGG
jgi:hypothetical protein